MSKRRTSVADTLAQYSSMLSSFNDAKHIITGSDEEESSYIHDKNEKREKIVPWGSSSKSAPKVPPDSSFDNEIKLPAFTAIRRPDTNVGGEKPVGVSQRKLVPVRIVEMMDQVKKKEKVKRKGSLENERGSVWGGIEDESENNLFKMSQIKQADTDVGGKEKHRNLSAFRNSSAFISLGLMLSADDRNDNEEKESSDKSVSCWKRHMCCIIVNFVAVAIISAFVVFTFILPENGSTAEKTKTIQSLPKNFADDASSSIPAAPRISLHDTIRAKENDLALMIQSRIPSIVFEDQNSPRSKALHWMIHDGYYSSFQLEDDKTLDKLLQRFALVTFWYSTNGEIWDSTKSWLQPNFNECYWKWLQSPQQQNDDRPKNKIVCDHSEDSILQLVVDFNSRALSGNIPAEIGLLQSLTVLNLSGNTLSGTIPSEIGNNLTNLVSLHLSNNRLEGSIPKEMFRRMTNLRVLTLNGNNLTGSIPTEIALLSKLSRLDLHDNALLGSIPVEIIGKLNNLNQLSYDG